MKIVNLILAGLFVVFAAVQFNDPDPIFWVIVYLGMAVITGFAAYKKYFIWLMLAMLAVLIYELFTLFPAFSSWIDDGMPSITESMKASTPFVELVREFLGLFLCVIVLLYHYVKYRRGELLNKEVI